MGGCAESSAHAPSATAIARDRMRSGLVMTDVCLARGSSPTRIRRTTALVERTDLLVQRVGVASTPLLHCGRLVGTHLGTAPEVPNPPCMDASRCYYLSGEATRFELSL